MSFGFGVGDFLAVLELARQVRQRWSDAPGEYTAAHNEIKRLKSVLEDLGDLSERVDISTSQKDILTNTIADCKNVLGAADKIVDRYSTTTTSGSRLRRSWKRFRADPDDVRHVRDQLVSIVTQLNVIQNSIQIELDREILSNVNDLKIDHDDENKLKIAKWFSPPAFAEQQAAQLNFREAGTAGWFLNHPSYLTWREGSKQTLFCPGIAGSGKSVIFATVVNDLHGRFDQDSGVVVTYFYCNYKRESEQRLPQILAALVRQLFQERDSIPDEVQKIYDRHVQRGSQPLVEELCLLVEHLVMAYSQVFVLLDALDECNNDDEYRTREKLLPYLINLQKQSGVSVNIMSTCRPGIVRHFDDCPQIEIRAQPEDVERYLRANINFMVPCVVKHPTTQQKVARDIASIVDGMFLLARLHLESLKDKTNVRSVLESLSCLPRGSASVALDKAYDEVLERINQQLKGHRDLARKTLTWLRHARRELSVDELREALAIRPNMTDIDPELDLDDEQTIISVCAGLVVIDDQSGVFRLAHYTAQVYLEHNQDRWLAGGGEYVATSCIDFLSMQVFYADGMDWGKNFWDQTQRYKLLRYVGENWGFHCCDIEDVRGHVDFQLNNRDFLCFASQLTMGDYGVGTYYCDEKEINPLQVCAYFDHEEAVLQLLQDGFDINSVDSSQRSALHIAARRGRTRIAEQLLARSDIDVNLRNNEGETPLYMAAEYGHTNIVSQLLARSDIEANMRDDLDITPLIIAAAQRHTDVVTQLLVRPEIDINVKEKECGQTALHDAVECGYADIVTRLLARSDVEANVRDKYGDTPLHTAADAGHAGIVAQLLARSDVELNVRDEYGDTALHSAVHGGHTDIVTQLLARSEIEVNVRDDEGETPLHKAAFRGHTGIVTQLLARPDIEVNIRDKDGKTPLYQAALHGHTDIVTQLRGRSDIEVDSDTTELIKGLTI